MRGALLGDRVLERDSELEIIDLALDRVSAGNGELLVFEGPVGIGKSQMLKAARDRGGPRGFRILNARAAEPDRGFPLSVVRQLLEPALAARSEGELAQRLPDQASRVVRAIVDQPLNGGGDFLVDEYSILHGVFALTAELAREQPVLLTVDDTQWADSASLRCLGYLVRRLGPVRMLVVVTTTPVPGDVAHSELEEIVCDPAAHIIRLHPLSVDAVSELMRFAAEAEPDLSFCAACHSASGGNPLFLREMLADLAARGIEPFPAETRTAYELGSRSLARLVFARLLRLSQPARALAEAVAVLGDGVSYRRAAELAQLDYAQAGAAARALVDAGIFEPSHSLSFAQGLVRAALHTRIDPARRDELHDRGARVLDRSGGSVDQVADMLLAAEPKQDEWVVDLLAAAAHDAAKSGALDREVAYLRRALAEPPPEERVPALLEELARAEVHGGMPVGFDWLRAAVDDADHPLRSETGLELGRLLGLVGDPAASIGVLETLRPDVGDEAGSRAERYELTVAAAQMSQLATAPDGARRLSALTDERRADASPDLLAAMALAGAARADARDEAVSHARQAIELMRTREDRDPVAICMAATALTWTDRLDLADPIWELFLADAQEDGSRLLFATASWFRSHSAYRRGALATARSAASAALEAVRTKVWGEGALLYPLAFHIDALVEQGEADAADDQLAELGLTAGLPELWQCNFVLDSRGRKRLAQCNYESALDDFLECGRRLEAWGVTNPGVIPWRSHAAAALAGADRAEEAYDLASQELELARRVGAGRAIGVAQHAAGLARGQDGIDLLREAVGTLTSANAPLELARALTDLGGALCRGGQRREARKPLKMAVELATRCEADALRDRAHSELLTAGARPRRVGLTGLESLTARERRIAALASDGMTNKRIADSIFLSEKTVELHLRNAYEKLEISGRSALARALGREA